MSSCMPSFSGSNRKTLQLHAIVEQPLTPLSFGRISCVAVGLEPIQFTWKGPYGKEIQLDATRSEAYSLASGRYTIKAIAADESRAEVSVDVAPALSSVMAINEYAVEPASSGNSCDGSVRAKGCNLESWNRFLWSNGTETTEAVLRDVRHGWYSVVPLPVDGTVPTFVQYCAPGQVPVASLRGP